MDKTPRNDDQLAAAVRRAMMTPPADAPAVDLDVDVDVDVESLALAAEGRMDELSEDQRRKLLRAIARDPAAGAALAELMEMNLACSPSTEELNAAGSDGNGEDVSRLVKFSRVTRGLFAAWAVAACLLAAVSLWRYAAPPPAHTGGPGPVQTYSDGGNGGSRYWDQLDSQRLHAYDGQGDRLRDLALAGSVATSILLSAALIISVCRDNTRRMRRA